MLVPSSLPQPWHGAFRIQRSLPTSGDVIQKLPSKHSPMLIFPVILDPVKLTVGINHHRRSVRCLAGKGCPASVYRS